MGLNIEEWGEFLKNETEYSRMERIPEYICKNLRNMHKS